MAAKKEQVRSKTLAVLDALGIAYKVKHSQAKLKVWDSLSIELAGDYAGFWTRWSRNVKGRNHIDLVNYMVQEGLVSQEDAQRVLGHPIEGTLIEVKKAEAYDFDGMVTNPRTKKIEDWLTKVRCINPSLIKRFIDLGLIVCDGRGNIRFLWKDPEGKVIGADVQGIERNEEEFGKRGYLKLILPGSHGFFNAKSADVADYSEVEHVYLTEAPIDMISLIELGAVKDSAREDSSFEFPRLKPKSLFISLSGAVTKLETTMNRLLVEYNLDPHKLQSIVVATDNDKAGDEAYDWFAANGYKNAERLIPNDDQNTLLDGVVGKVNDWNELLQRYKRELDGGE